MVLFSGESGAGKTENTKKVIQYFASIARNEGKGKDSVKFKLGVSPLYDAGPFSFICCCRKSFNLKSLFKKLELSHCFIIFFSIQVI